MSVLKLKQVLGNGTGCLLTHSRRFSPAATSPSLAQLIPGLVACSCAGQWEETEV